ncbi:hypothetical protein LINPERHAP1_LOCUS23021 [Linum perenne]
MDEDSTAAAATNNEFVNALKRKSDDIGWQYGTLADPLNNKDKVKCNFCDKVSMGGVYRLKQHISGYGSSVKTCTKAPPEAVQACRKTFEETAKKKKEKLAHDQGLRDDVHITSGHGAPNEDITCVAVSFNSIDNDEFKQMCEAIGQFGPGLKPPTQYDLRETLLKSEYARTKSLLKDRDEEKMKNGCSLMTDAWTDMKSFIKSKDTSDVSHTSEVIFNLVDNAIEEVGAEHVVQVVTDNASNNMGAKALLLEKRPNIFWSSCATHTINLMLQGIGNLPKFKKVIDQTKAFTIFIYGHHRTLECMRSFTKKREIIRPGVTRFASQYLTLQSMMEKKDSLRRMVVDAKWDGLKDVHTKKGKDATATILNVTYWKAVNLCLKVFETLVIVLRLVDGDVKPSMGFVYGEIVKAKREIKEAFGNVEIRYKEVMAIVDKKMRGRLDGPLQLTAYMLNPYYSYVDSSISDDTDITTAFIACVEQFYNGSCDDIQDQVVNHEYIKFSKKEGLFGKKIARAYENFDYNPG